LKSLDTPQKVAEFTQKIQQSILKQMLARQNKSQGNNDKPKNT